MRCIFLLGGDYPELAKEEVLMLAKTEPTELIGRVLVCDANFKWKRLGLTKKVYQFLFESKLNNIETTMADFEWNKVYKKNFSVRITNLTKQKVSFKEAELAKYIWKKVDVPKVDLEYSQTPVELIFTPKKVLCGLLLHEVNGDFSKRRGHLRPASHPTTMSPKLARACVNLTGIETGSVVIDPFCGTGGILIEAGLMRFKTVGYDIDEVMLQKCQKNLEFFKVKRFSLQQRDAMKLDEDVPYVVTDLPYGLHSKTIKPVKVMYADFLKFLNSHLKFKAVVLFPHFVDHRLLIRASGLLLENEFEIPVHKGLTRYVVLLSRKSE